MRTPILYNQTQLTQVAAQLLPALQASVVFFEGDMGAGKTTLISALMQAQGCTAHVSSPTFSLVNTYVLPDGSPLYHMDLYRLLKIEEALDMGIEDYLYSGHPCWIEWADRIAPIWPAHYQQIEIKVLGPTQRELQLFSHPQ